MKNDVNVNIKNLVDKGSYIVVFDTNVFLNLYRISPDYADFLLSCMETIQENIIVPKTIQIEFIKHNEALFNKVNK